jgi:hypothetical protein
MDDSSERVSDTAASGKKGLKSEMIVAIAAITVSILTLFVYVYQARIMMKQQHTSVWPYVEWATTRFNTDTEQEFYVEVINKGVGPALVKGSRLTIGSIEYREHRDTVDGKFIGNYEDMMRKLVGKTRHDSLWIMYSVINDRVLAPGEAVKIFHVKNGKARIPPVDNIDLAFSICYCNIFDDCWTTHGSVSKESECD